MSFKKKSLAITTGLALTSMALIGCGDDVALSADDNVKIQSDVTIVVRDAATGSFIDSAMVIKVDSREDTNYTEAIKGGAIVFKNVLVGNQYFKVEKADYASKVITASVALAAAEETPIAETPSFSVDLPEVGAIVKGVVTQENLKGEKALVKGQAVRLILNDNSFITREFSATTDSLGQYSFTNLPTGQGYVISFADLEATDGTKTAPSNSGTTLAKGATLFETNSNFTLGGYSQTVLSTNVADKDIKSTDAITYTFSQPVNLDAFETQNITVSSGGKVVPVTAAWSNGNKTLTISAAAGEWFPGNATISGLTSIESTSGKSLSSIDNTFKINVLGALTAMSGYSVSYNDSNVVAHNTSSVGFKFTPLANTSSILVYAKEAEDVNYKLLSTKSITAQDSMITGISTSNYFTEAKAVSFVLVPKNDEGSPAFDATKGISVKDGYLPYTTTQGSQAVADTVDVDYSSTTFDNSLATTDRVLNSTNISFNEPMDTTTTPAVPAGLLNTTVEYEWTSTTRLNISYSVLAGKEVDGTSADASAPVYFAKDLAGNVSIDGIEITVKQ